MTASSSLQPLIGTWEFDASVEGRFLGRGRATFEWIEDGAFVLERAVDLPTPETDPRMGGQLADAGDRDHRLRRHDP